MKSTEISVPPITMIASRVRTATDCTAGRSLTNPPASAMSASQPQRAARVKSTCVRSTAICTAMPTRVVAIMRP